MARIQSRSYGQYLVWCARMDWRHMCTPNDPSYLEQLAKCKVNLRVLF